MKSSLSTVFLEWDTTFRFYCIGVLNILQDFRHTGQMDLSKGGHALHIHDVCIFRVCLRLTPGLELAQ